MAKQLSSVYDCNVIIIKNPSNNDNFILNNIPRITTYECDVFSSDKLSNLSKMLDKTSTTIDLFINNGVTLPESIANSPESECQHTVTTIGDNIKARINVI